MELPTIEEIEEHVNDDDHAGWCTNCGEWTHDCCEPDAHHYECPVCEQKTCFGAEECIIQGLYK